MEFGELSRYLTGAHDPGDLEIVFDPKYILLGRAERSKIVRFIIQITFSKRPVTYVKSRTRLTVKAKLPSVSFAMSQSLILATSFKEITFKKFSFKEISF